MSKAKKLKNLFASMVLLFLSINLVKGSIFITKKTKRLDDLKQEISLLQAKKENLEDEVAYKKTEEFVEETARNELSLIKPGEKMYVVVGGQDGKEKSTTVLGAAADKKTQEDITWYQWYRLFFE